MDGAELALTALRGVHLAAALAAFGIAVFWSVVAAPLLPAADESARAGFEARSRRLYRGAMLVALVAGVAWLLGGAAYDSEAESVADAAAAVWPMLTDTQFGRVLGIRLILLVIAALGLGDGARSGRRALAAVAAGLAIALQSLTAHGAAAAGTAHAILLAAEPLHLLAAGAWLGALPSLFILCTLVPPSLGARALRRFSPIGMLCVAVIAATALVQAWFLIGSVPALIGTDYGRVAVLKLALFLLMLGLAAAHRFHHAQVLGAAPVPGARRRLRRSVGLEMALGLAVVLAAALLADLPPALHEQPLWPFAWQPNIDILSDPDLGAEARQGAFGAAAALLLVPAALVWRRPPIMRWLCLAAAAAMAVWAAPHVDLLTMTAYPTSFYRSPTRFAATTIAQGAALFPDNCSRCHGAGGKGDGPDAKALPIPPADLTAAHLWYHSDGELFWWLAHGIEAPEGGFAMPGFAESLSDDDRWALIDYVRAHNAGVALAATGEWPHPIPAPDIAVTCGGRALSLAALQGRTLRIVAADDAPGTSVPSATTILLARHAGARPAGETCVAADPAAWTAYAIAAGTDAEKLAGTQFLVDPQGWLRRRARPDDSGWADPAQLSSAVETMLAHPIGEGLARPDPP